MRATLILVTSLLALLIIAGGTPARAQTPASLSSLTSRGGSALAVDRARFDSRATRPIGPFDARAPRGFVPHRHWSWLFPNSAVAPFGSDPLQRRHRWQDPLLRRHWWQ